MASLEGRVVIPLRDGRRLSAGDLVIVLAVVTVLYTLVRPVLLGRGFRDTAAELSAAVDVLGTAATSELGRTGAWPSTGAPGELPFELVGILAEDELRPEAPFTLQWIRWSVVDSTAVPVDQAPADPDDAPPIDGQGRTEPLVRTVGSVIVHARDERLLGHLLAQYGRENSFVRDTTWTFVLPQRGPS